jgi:hypothetical protein
VECCWELCQDQGGVHLMFDKENKEGMQGRKKPQIGNVPMVAFGNVLHRRIHQGDDSFLIHT